MCIKGLPYLKKKIITILLIKLKINNKLKISLDFNKDAGVD